MATFTLSADTNIDALTGKEGGDFYTTDTYDINQLTIDQHSLYGLTQVSTAGTAATSIGNISGHLPVLIDGRKVRMIPFDTGSGTIPALNTLITQGSASGKLMCIYTTDMTIAPLVDGATMPTAGWVQVKQWNSTEYTSGALTGLTANCTGASKVGFLQLLFSGHSIQRMDNPHMHIEGEWYELGLTDGTATKTYQVPTNGTNCFIGGVFVEKSAGSNTFDIYPNVSYATNQTFGTEEIRGKVCWIDYTTGQVRLGSFDGTTLSGFTPEAGRRVVIPNIIINAVDATNRQTVLLGTDPIYWLFQGQTSVIIHKACIDANAPYASTTQASLDIKHAMYTHKGAIFMQGSPKDGSGTITDTFLGGTTYNLNNGENTLNYLRCVSVISVAQGTGVFMNGEDESIWTDCRFQMIETQPLNYHYSRGLSLLTTTNTVINNCLFIACNLYMSGCTNNTINNIGSVAEVSGTTQNVAHTYYDYDESVINLIARCFNTTITGFSIPLADNQPNGCLVYLGNSKNLNTTVQNIGSLTNPLNLDGVTNPTKYFINYYTPQQKNENTVVRNCYVTGSTIQWDNEADSYSNKISNCGAGYASISTGGLRGRNGIIRGLQATWKNYLPLINNGVAKGTIITDYFDSTTTGFLQFVDTLQGSSLDKITQIVSVPGTVYPPDHNYRIIGEGMEYEMGYYRLGHTGFQDLQIDMRNNYGSSPAYFDWNYSIDLNDGSGWSPMTTANYTYQTFPTALSAITIDPVKGFKLKFRMTLNQATTYQQGSVKRFAIFTTSSLTAQAVKYPDKLATFTITGLQPGSIVGIYDNEVLNLGDNDTLLASTANSDSSFSYTHVAETTNDVVIDIIKTGYVEKVIKYTIGTADQTLPIKQIIDIND